MLYLMCLLFQSEVEPPINEADQSAETMVNNFRSSLEMLSDRMQSTSGKGKHIAMDATIQVIPYHIL